MSHRMAGVAAIKLALDRHSAIPLQHQIYMLLRERIVNGTLAPGAQLPSTRAMTQELGVSRMTIVNAYDQLHSEGYIESRRGTNYTVSVMLHEFPAELRDLRLDPDQVEARLSPFGESCQGDPTHVELPVLDERPWRAFKGTADVETFPLDVWTRLHARRRTALARFEVLSHTESIGHEPLRRAIAEHLSVTRGMRCDPNQVLIVAGRYHALDLICRILLSTGSSACIEEPDGRVGLRVALTAVGAKAVPIDVDENGFDVSLAKQRCPNPAAIFVSPSQQLPTGRTMSLARRIELLGWAVKTGAWIIEDDFNSEFCYTTQPLGTLQGIDPCGRVIFLYNFNQTMFPGLGIGCIVAPKSLVPALATAKVMTCGYLSTLTQATMADFINEGWYAKRLHKLRAITHERQELMKRLLEPLAPWFDYEFPPFGANVCPRVETAEQERFLVEELRRRDVYVAPLSMAFVTENRQYGIALSYGGTPLGEIERGMAAVADVARQHLPARPQIYNVSRALGASAR